MASKLFLRTTSGRTAIVDTGFSWSAFIFGPLWAVAKRQWLLFVLLCAAQIPFTWLFMLAEQRHDGSLLALSCLVGLTYMIVCGVYANRWHRRFLERQGFSFEGFVEKAS